MKKKDVDEVVVVGGSSRIPKVQRMVEEYFEGKTLYMTMNGDEAVASGAAIMAVRLSGNDDNMKDVVLQDVTPLSLGIAVQINGVRDNIELKIAIDLLTNGSSENEGSNLAKAVHPSLCYGILSFLTWWVRSGLYSVLKSYPFREMEMASKDTGGTRITNLAIGGKMFITGKDQQCVEVWQSTVRRS
uniref:Putative heat shock protein 70 family, peptide-binding domain protein n=1 Tax=Tanacetum cinerariifolium TaxID=118510 RepID=A0A6L2JEJ8_TANCI|nr:putative heat shock protein 70 family, peptide-binding domain protein [Tanacetum cinerariifolium]